MEDNYIEVDFAKYCKLCEHKDLDEKFDPCCECLDYEVNFSSSKPVNFKENKNGSK